MGELSADRPAAAKGAQYHLETSEGDLAPHCLLVGDPDRATLIAEKLFDQSANSPRKVGDHRGLRSYTGTFKDVPVSVVTTGMGGGSTSIVLPEAVRSGAQRFIRVGSCGVIQPGPKVGESVIASGAVRLDGASDNWAIKEYPALADFRIVNALVDAAQGLGLPNYVGIEATTSCFYEGQARPDDDGFVPKRILDQHDEFVKRGVLFYSMESSTIFVWCSTHGGYWAGSVNAVYAQRVTNDFGVSGQEETARIALEAVLLLNERYPLSQ
jgi:uridine phosphorylase